MDYYNFFKDFAAPMATAAAAFAAAIVTSLFSYRQSKTADLQARIALDRLKYDTFEHRHDVLDACRDLMQLYSIHKLDDIIDTKAVGDCSLRIAEGRFYFCKSVNDEIVEYVKAAADLAGARFKLHHIPKHHPLRKDSEAEIAAGTTALRNNLMKLHTLMEYDLSLNLLKEGSEAEHRGRESSPRRWWPRAKISN